VTRQDVVTQGAVCLDGSPPGMIIPTIIMEHHRTTSITGGIIMRDDGVGDVAR
jgi:hypothetical protein